MKTDLSSAPTPISAPPAPETPATRTRVLLGDEAVAEAALDAGVSVAYAYPGTPSTEILEYLVAVRERTGHPNARWCANEKTAYEEALGASFVGRRALVAMKHVGLNVAADPFVNSALVAIGGGLVLAVADDPGMHSSQNEQDSRHYADFARVPCLEPADQQQAYDMTREAFALSETMGTPVLVRLVTRLAHSRAVVHTLPTEEERPLAKTADPTSWILLPSNARRRWKSLLERQPAIHAWSEGSPWNRLELVHGNRQLGVVTTGIARNYFLENRGEMVRPVSHLHIGTWPAPAALLRELASHVKAILVLEDGYPFLERQLRGILPGAVEIRGKESGHLPPCGELDPDVVRPALGLAARAPAVAIDHPIGRPPQLCAGCSHDDAFQALARALEGFPASVVTSDIGCYTLGAYPPHRIIESCVAMGASVGMAKGASEAGFRPVVAVIGDSTFLHSGVTPLMDAVSTNADMTLLILDNEAVAMTGAQPTILPGASLRSLVLGLGVDPAHCHLLDAHPRHVDTMAATIRREMEHPGLSVIISARECVESARRRKSEKR